MMPKLIIIFLLMLLSNSSLAGWTQVAISADGDEYYVELDTRKFNEDLVKVWVYVNYGTGYKGSTPSVMGQDEYDCKNEMERNIYLAAYTKPHLQGDIDVKGEINAEWTPIPPHTAGTKMFKAICNR
jgi:hypothetical protein